MDSRFSGYSSRSKIQELGAFNCNNVEPFQQFTRREKINRQIQNLQQGNGEKTKTLNYWGKVRKCAVRTSPAITRPGKKEHEVDASDGRTKNMFMPCELGYEMGNYFLSPKGEIGNACQMFDERRQRVMIENKSLISAKLSKSYGIGSAVGTNTNTNVSCKPKMGNEKSEMNIGGERKKLLNWFRAECELLRNRRELCNRIDHMAYNVLKESGELYMNEKKLGPIPGVEIEDRFEFRLELVIMGIHVHHLRGIDYMETSKGRVLAVSIVATEGYGDCMRADELIYTGEGGNFEATSKGVKHQELKGGNLALKNSVEEGNYVRVVRGVKSSGKNMRATKTTFVYDGLYKVVDYGKKTGVNGSKMQFEFKLKRSPGQKIIDWAKYK